MVMDNKGREETEIDMHMARYTWLEEIVEESLHLHGLTQRGWIPDVNLNKQRLGYCDYKKKIISLSGLLVELNKPKIISLFERTLVDDIISHEIAHALVGSGHQHDHVWKMKAGELGLVDPGRALEIHQGVEPRWIYICSRCDGVFTSHVKSRKRYCQYCLIRSGSPDFDESNQYDLIVENPWYQEQQQWLKDNNGLFYGGLLPLDRKSTPVGDITDLYSPKYFLD